MKDTATAYSTIPASCNPTAWKMEPRRRRRTALAAVLILLSASSNAEAFPPKISGRKICGRTRASDSKRRRAPGSAARRPDLLSVRGGALPPSHSVLFSANSGRTTAGAKTGAAVNVGGSRQAYRRPVADVNGRRTKFLRVASELARHVWPEIPSRLPRPKQSTTDPAQSDATELKLEEAARAFNDGERRLALSIRLRVVASVLLMLAGKVATICTPFIFKMLVDTVPGSAGASGGTATSAKLARLLHNLPFSPPVLLLVAYGLFRSLSSLCREGTNAVFAGVAQSAIRRFGRSTFDHVS